MKFEWDEEKRQTNIRKHGIDFVGVEELFTGYTVTMEDSRFDYDETRFITIGLLKGHIVVVHTECQEAIRIISIRKATKYEERTHCLRRRPGFFPGSYSPLTQEHQQHSPDIPYHT